MRTSTLVISKKANIQINARALAHKVFLPKFRLRGTLMQSICNYDYFLKNYTKNT